MHNYTVKCGSHSDCYDICTLCGVRCMHNYTVKCSSHSDCYDICLFLNILLLGVMEHCLQILYLCYFVKLTQVLM